MAYDVIIYFLMNSLVFLLFLPGILLFNFISKRFNLSLSLPEIIVIGSVFWNAILVVPSLFLGLFSLGMLWYFTLFTIASITIFAGFGLYFLVKKYKETSLKIHIGKKSDSFLAWAHLLPVWLFIVLLTIYTPVILDWDWLQQYLPMAKSIILTGNLTYSPYMLSETAMAFPPLLPIIYAWSIQLANGLYLRFLSIILFFLTILVIWQLTKMIGGNSLISVIAFSSMLSVEMLVSENSLYLDLPFIFYASAAIYLVARILSEKSHRMFWYLCSGLTSALGALTHEGGAIILFLIFSFCLLCLTRSIIGRLIFTLVTALPFIALFSIELYSGYPFLEIFILFLVIFILSIGLLYASTKLVSTIVSTSKGESMKGLVLFSIACIPALIFYARNIFVLNVFTARLPILQASSYAALGFVPSSTEPPDPINYLLWYRLFLAAGLGAPYIVPLVVGSFLILYKSSKRDRVSLIFLSWLITTLLMWSVVFRCQYMVTDFRRLTHFASIFSILISMGASALYERLKLGKYPLRLFVLSNVFILSYIWVYRWNIDLFFAYRIFETDILDFVFFFSAFVIPILILYRIHKDSGNRTKFGGRTTFSRRLSGVFLLSTLLVFSLPPIYMVALSSNEINRETWDPNYYNTPATMWVWTDVIQYYNTYTNDNYVTAGFYNYPLIVFANRSYIDPATYYGFASLLPFLLCNDTNSLLAKLYSQNIRYFIIPKPNCPSSGALERYEILAQRYLLFKIVTHDPHFTLCAEFVYFYLYKLVG